MSPEIVTPRNKDNNELLTPPEKKIITPGSERQAGSENKETEEFFGVQTWGATTAAWLFNPVEGLEVISEINKNRDQKLVVELYATHFPLFLRGRLPQSAIKALEKFTPPDLTTDDIDHFSEKFKNVPIEAVHGEFNYSFWEEIFRIIFGEEFFPKVAEGNLKDRAVLTAMNRAYQGAWMLFFGQARRKGAAELAAYLNEQSTTPSGIVLNLHTNIIQGFAQDGELGNVRESVSEILAEPERPYLSPVMISLSRELGIPLKELVSNPSIIKEHIIDRYPEVGGMTFGADHLLPQGIDPSVSFKEVLDVVHSIHMAGGEGSEAHTAVDFEDPNTERFLKTLFTSPHSQPMTLYLDLNPELMKDLSFKEQVQFIEETIDELEDLQKEYLDNLE